jgi:hypothetical protein
LLDDPQKEKFLVTLPSCDGFWKKFGALQFAADAFAIYRALISEENESGAQARSELRLRLKSVPPETWAEILQDGREPLPLALKLIERGDEELDLSQPLLTALDKVIDLALDGKAFDAGLVANWFKLAGALSKNTRGIFFKGVKDRMISSPKSGSLPILLGGGELLLKEGQFQSQPDQAARHLIKPLLDLNPTGINWLVSHATDVAPWIEGAEDDTKGYVAERLAEFGNQVDEVLKKAATELAAKWKLKKEIADANRKIADQNKGQDAAEKK